ncbi:MAG: exodeoxyribonuclease VII large subunit, partial [Patescibacteria group bacterium]
LISRISNMSARLRDNITSSKSNITGMKRILLALSPEQTLQRGYSITRSKSGAVIKNAKDISAEDELVTTLAKGSIISVVRKTSA